MATVHLLAWDCRQQPDLDALDKHVYHLSLNGPVRITQIDTDDQDYAIAIANRELDKAEASQLYDRHCSGDTELSTKDQP